MYFTSHRQAVVASSKGPALEPEVATERSLRARSPLCLAQSGDDVPPDVCSCVRAPSHLGLVSLSAHGIYSRGLAS